MPTHPTLPGTCRTTEMSEYEQDFVDAEVEAYIRIDAEGRGEFQFGYVCGSMTIEFTTRRGKPAAAWSWEGTDEMDAASGRG